MRFISKMLTRRSQRGATGGAEQQALKVHSSRHNKVWLSNANQDIYWMVAQINAQQRRTCQIGMDPERRPGLGVSVTDVSLDSVHPCLLALHALHRGV